MTRAAADDAVRRARAAAGADPASECEIRWWTNDALRISFRLALGVTHDYDLAEDVAQDVAIKVATKSSTIRHPSAFFSWLQRTTLNTAIDAVRKRDRQREADTRYATDRSINPEQVEHPPALVELLQVLETLPDQQRAAVVLRYVGDLSDDAIASALHCRPVTVRVWISRAKAHLRRDHGFEIGNYE